MNNTYNLCILTSYCSCYLSITSVNFITHFFVQDGAKVCQEFMARDRTEMHFNVVALATAQ